MIPFFKYSLTFSVPSLMAFHYLLLISLLLLPTYLLIKKNKHRSSIKPYPIIGHLPQFLKNRHRSFEWFTELLSSAETNTIKFHRFGDTRTVITANPRNIEHMLKSDFDNFPKGPRIRFMLHDFLGNGIFNSDGHQWKAQRKTTSYEFNTRSLRDFVVETVQHESSTRLVPLLKKYVKTEQAFDIQNVLERYSFDNICKVAFNVDPACLSDDAAASEFADAFRDASSYSAGRFRYVIPELWRVKKLLNIGSERRLKESISTVHDFAMDIIRKRMKDEESSSSKHQKEDLLSRFIAAGEYSEDFLRDIVISFLIAGRETTSSALSWFFWIVSSRRDIQNKIVEEIKSIRARNKDGKTETFEFDELRGMQYLHAALMESMRLYPPVPLSMTECLENTTLPDGMKIKKGEFMLYHSYAMGRMENVWGKDCKEYRPERWLDENGMFRHESPFKFLTFHAGPRMCLGKEMAYIQMKSIVACVLERFVVEMVDAERSLEENFSLTLKIKGGLPVLVRCR